MHYKNLLSGMGNYGEYFKALRESKNLTLREVEKKTSVSNAYLSQLESGKVKQPSPLMLHKLAEIYEVDYDLLMSKVGYPISTRNTTKGGKSQISHRMGQISEEEELELLEYLKFIRNRKK